MTTENEGATGEETRRSQARALIVEAEAARGDGNDDEAERLLDEATRIDPQATEDALAANPRAEAVAEPAGTDEEVRLVTATIQPHSDAPSRAGITGSGSGADDM